MVVDDRSEVVAENDLDERAGRVLPQRRASERRGQARRYFETPVRFMTDDAREFEGVLKDISATGVRIATDEPPPIGTSIILYVDRIGRFEGTVVRLGENEFALKMRMSGAKLARLEQSIRLFFEQEAADAPISDRRNNISDRRAHERCVVDIDEIIGLTAGGDQFECKIANLSLGGAEIITSASLSLGQLVKIGNVEGVITRVTDTGFAVQRTNL